MRYTFFNYRRLNLRSYRRLSSLFLNLFLLFFDFNLYNYYFNNLRYNNNKDEKITSSIFARYL